MAKPVISEESSGEIAIKQQSNSSLAAAQRNLRYLISPSQTAPKSIRLRTRVLLRSLHHIGVFIFWRLVRYAKYIAVGSLVAAVSASTLGTLITPIGWLAAPPTMAASIIAASVWGVGRFAAGRLHARWQKDGGTIGEEMRSRAEDGAVESDGRVRGVVSGEVGPRAMPW